jgi:vancomycin resistance protein VanJ
VVAVVRARGGHARPHRRRGRLVVAAAVGLALVVAGHRLVPNVYGLGSLLDSVTPLLVVGVPVLLLMALLRRSRPAALAVLLPALVWTGLFGPGWLPTGVGGAAQFRVASQNLLAGNPDPGATLAPLVGRGVDLLALQEISEAALPPVRDRLAAAYPYHAVLSTVGLWSRYPIRGVVGVDTGLTWTRALRAEVVAPGGDLVVYVVHLGSARAGDTATRDRTLRVLTGRLRADPARRLVVLGDLNTATTDRVLRPLTRLLADAQVRAGEGPGFTWPSAVPLIRPDHVLYRGVTAVSAGVVRTPSSDHRAVTAAFRR